MDTVHLEDQKNIPIFLLLQHALVCRPVDVPSGEAIVNILPGHLPALGLAIGVQTLELVWYAIPFPGLVFSGHTRIDGGAHNIPPKRYAWMTRLERSVASRRVIGLSS